jgi:hypothetical protein
MKKPESDSQKRIAFATRLQFDAGADAPEVPEWIQVCPIGTWKDHYKGEVKITPDDIQEMIRNFNAGVMTDLPITAGHDNGFSGGELPAVAWYGELDAREDGLWTNSLLKNPLATARA